MLKKYIWVLSVTAFLFSCNKTEETPEPQVLLTSADVSTKNQAAIKADFTQLLGNNAIFLQQFVRYDIKEVKITYKTKNADGTDITASGALYVPVLAAESKETLPLASIQHGTLFEKSQAPSNFGTQGEALSGLTLATSGYIVAMPDYIGYGASAALDHPYEHRETLGQSSLDMLRAVKEYITQKKLAWNNSLYVAGYSEGGFASMSLLKKINDTAPTEFTIKAASLGAGAYDKTAFTKYVATNKTAAAAQYNASYIWTILTYDKIYKLNRATNTYFKEPHASIIAAQKQNANITVPLNDILTDAFKAAVGAGTDAAFASAVKDNDNYDWKPTYPVRLYHGTADEWVPIFNSENAEKAMKAKGATNVVLVKLAGKNHSTAVQDFLLGTVDLFGANK